MLLTACLVLEAQQVPAGAAGGGRGGNPARTREFLGLSAPPNAAAAARGARLYGPNCAFCHGEKANGAEGPDLVRSPLVLHDDNGETIGPVLIEGRPARGMPAFSSLTPSDVRDIAAFLHMRVEFAANRGTYRALDVVTGDARQGEQYFRGAGGCAACHSPTGDLAHIAARFAPDQLQNRFLWPAGGTPRITVTLPSGQSYSGTVKRLDDFVVELVDSAGHYHSWTRIPGLKVRPDDRLAAHRKLLDRYTDSDIHDLTAYLVTLR